MSSDAMEDRGATGESRNSQGVQPAEDFGEIATQLASELGKRLTEVHYNALARFEQALPAAGPVCPERVADEKANASQAPVENQVAEINARTEATALACSGTARIVLQSPQVLQPPHDLSTRRPILPIPFSSERSGTERDSRYRVEPVTASERGTIEPDTESKRCTVEHDQDAKLSTAGIRGAGSTASSVGTADNRFEPRQTWLVEKLPVTAQQARCSGPGGLQRSWTGAKLWTESREFAHRKFKFDPGSYVLHPQGMYRLIWDMLAAVFLLYDFIFVPLEAFDLPDTEFKRVSSMIILIYWTLDIVASLRTGVFLDGKLSLKARDIARSYIRTWLVFDCIVVLPEWLMLVLNESIFDLGLNRLAKGLRLLRMARLLRIGRVEEMLNHLKDRINGTYVTLIISMTRLILALCILLHLFACAWYALGRASRRRGWIYLTGINEATFEDRYLFTFIWAMARLHPSSYKENLNLEENSERIFAIATSLLALCLGGFFVSSVTNTMFQLQHFHDDRNRKLYTLRQYVRDNNITSKIGVRVHKYLEQSLRRKAREMRAAQLQDILPPDLVADLHADAWSPILSRHLFFEALIHRHFRVVWYLGKEGIKEESFLNSDRIFASGDPCARMTFVAHGKLNYSWATRKSMVEMVWTKSDAIAGATQNLVQTRGMALSEPSLWTHWTHHGELFGTEDSTLLFLSVDTFIHAMAEGKETRIAAAVRAKQVINWLNDPGSELSDILPMILTTGRSSKRGKEHNWAHRVGANLLYRGSGNFDQIVPTDS